MEEKLAEYGAMQERVRVEMEVKGGELRQVKERSLPPSVCVCVSYHMLYHM